MNLDLQIIGEIYKSLVLLGAQSDLLGVVGSWRDSLPDRDVLLGLQAWNADAIQETRARVQHCEAL